MDNSLKYLITVNEAGIKLREYLRSRAKLSSRLIKGAAKDERICVNGKVTRLNYILKEGDQVSFGVIKSETQDIEPEDIPIDVVYEDDDILVVNKDPGIVVHPTKSYPSHTLANGIMNYFKETNQNCIVRLVSRLDMDTSGLIIIAKNQFSHMALARDKDREDFKKTYLAIVHGNLKEKRGTIDLPIYRPLGSDIRRVIDERGQKSITHFEVVDSFSKGDFVRLCLETGRTHQIRVHMANLGHPIFGDSLYGEEELNYIKRQALHAYKLSFPHPRTGEVLNLKADLPEDMNELLKKLKEDNDV